MALAAVRHLRLLCLCLFTAGPFERKVFVVGLAPFEATVARHLRRVVGNYHELLVYVNVWVNFP